MKLHEFSLVSQDSETCYDIFQDVLKIVRREAEEKMWSQRYCLVYLGFTEIEGYKRQHNYEVHTTEYIHSLGRVY